ncbi:unnamed protein product [Sphagnum troendelagicum]|uniref:Transcriptional adapter 2-alpha/beta-like domain-containing protein n=1 Tax=Sphagnum troendelagicum TaxID=128251 RepID=A0ABP0T7U6_9BRYO
MIESCGLGNWIDVANRMSRDPNECRSHFEEIYLSPSSSPFNLFFSSFSSNKRLIGEEVCNVVDLQSSSIIYPPMLVESEEQRLLTYMPHRDEYEREYHNEAENRLPGLTIDDEEIDATEEEDPSRRLLRQGKLALLRAYAQILRRRLQLKHYIRDYAIGLTIQTSTQPDQQSDQICVSLFVSLVSRSSDRICIKFLDSVSRRIRATRF